MNPPPKISKKSLPDSVDILGHRVEVRLTDSIDEQGRAEFEARIIYINSSLAHDQQVEVLIHEVIEFAGSWLDLGLDHYKICCIEMVIFQALKSGDLLDV